MADLAPGPISGFLFQFEKALSILAGLSNSNDTVSIEKVDDIAIHDENDVVIMTIQAKHSISPSGSTFEDTSKALWRTLELWIDKLMNNELNETTQFVCCTNKKIPQGSLLRNIKDKTIAEVIGMINALLSEQKDKLKVAVSQKDTGGKTIKETIKRIEYVLSYLPQFEIIKNNIVIDDEIDPKDIFFISVHMSNKQYNDERRAQTFQSMYGWIVDITKAKWKNSESAAFSKEDFENRFAICFNNPSIVNAVFRKKSSFGPINEDLVKNTRKELFVKQIEDIKRNKEAKHRKIENAILDFIYHDIEIAHLSKQGELTQSDFDQFRQNCQLKWQTFYDSIVIKELEDYDEDTKNALAISIFDSVMDKVEVKFQGGIEFTSDNKYIHNGTFLKLSNIPEIGWHPDWKNKYPKL